MSVLEITSDSHFQQELQSAGARRLVVVDFTASWCGPCQYFAPYFDQLAYIYNRAIFLKVDVDKCKLTAAMQGVRAMPTFILYKNKIAIDRMQGANLTGLESKIKEHIGIEEEEMKP